MKLTDTQLVILSAASQRETRAIELPPNLKGSAAHKVVGKLLAEGFVEEVPARNVLPEWRRDKEDQSLALRITREGLRAIGTDDEPEEPGSAIHHGRARATGTAKRKEPRSGPKGAPKTARRTQAASAARSTGSDTKQARVIALLSRREGVTVATIVKATGWQPHSVRGFFAGVVRKKLGLTLTAQKTEGDRVYRIIQGKRRTATTGSTKR